MKFIYVPGVRYGGETESQAQAREDQMEAHNRQEDEIERKNRQPMKAVRKWAKKHGLKF